ncbi:hypothetical protein POM88_024571 [Heracleum sosnowskyi]|uniref:Uncharacterized protein n=1 Tax=Heracleum sosnowskyi TaxID=360622 RepID=A0AAD8I2A4_9APIA|nr:hypothetical protein POM88_024571 [Heracleum sosnowskyi]
MKNQILSRLLASSTARKSSPALQGHAYSAAAAWTQRGVGCYSLFTRNASSDALVEKEINDEGFKGHGMLAPFTAGWQSTDLNPLVIAKSEILRNCDWQKEREEKTSSSDKKKLSKSSPKAGEVAPPPAVVKPPTVVKPLLVYVRVMGGSAAEKKATACSGMKQRRLEDKPGGYEASRRKSSYRRRLMMLLNKPLLR